MITLHHVHKSRSMRVLWLLHELGLDVEVVLQSLDKSLREPGFLQRSPAGRVPALRLGDETIFESGAMIELLTERYPDAGLGRAPDHPERANWLVWLHFAETISQHVAALTQQHIMLYDDAMRAPIVMKLEAARIGKCYEAIEARLAESGDYLLESGFSAADIAVGQAVYMARHFRHIAPLPALSRWYARITARPGFQASLPPEGAQTLYDKDFYEAWEA